MLMNFEKLETRRLLTATATFNNGTLTILGDAGDDSVEIDQFDENDVDLGAGNVEVILNNGTPEVFDGVVDIVVDLGAGRGDVSFYTAANIGGDVSMTFGAGQATVHNYGDLKIGGNLSIDMSQANVSGGGVELFSATFEREVSIKLGDGNDTVGLGDVVIREGLKIDMGGGNDLFESVSVDITGNLSYKGGSGNDCFALTSSHVCGNAKLTMGAGNDEIALFDVAVTGRSVFNGGSGADVLTISDPLNFFNKAPRTPGFEQFL
ncbi:MAG: hypothetical protein R3C01_03315 [Planctomycetaceae bacterium]